VEPALWQAAGVVQLSSPAPAPPLSLRDLSGELVDLRGLRGRVVMLYFWATW
jgi:peroxiredoxin